MKETRNKDIAAGTKELNVVGTPIVFDTPTVIHSKDGDYTEIIQRGALDGVDLSKVKLLYNHDVNALPLATAGVTMELRTDNVGLHMNATLPETEHGKSVHTAIKRGDIEGMSFAFSILDQEYNPETRTRIIKKFKEIFEISVLPFPAYEQTTIEARGKGEPQGVALDSLRIRLNQILQK